MAAWPTRAMSEPACTSLPRSSTTPPNPMAMPASLTGPRRSPSSGTDMNATKNGMVPNRMAPRPDEMYWTPQNISPLEKPAMTRPRMMA